MSLCLEPKRSEQSRPRVRWRIGLLATTFVSLLMSRAPAVAAEPACRGGISPQTAQRLFAILNRPPAEPDCAFAGVDTNEARLEARWARNGSLLPPLTLMPRECASGAAQHTGRFAVDVPPAIAQNCPSVLPFIAEFVKQAASEAPGGEIGSLDDPLFRAARLLFIGILLIGGGLLVRAATNVRTLDARWSTLGMASFAAALAVRAALPFSLGNWYAEVLPATGPPPWMRFGPGVFAFQSLLRDAGLWGPRALLLSQLLLGAAALPLLLGVMRELQVGLEATAAALVLLIFAPFHARLSATSSEHVLASTLCLALLLAWLRTARTGERMWMVLTALLFPAVCATRVDMTVQAWLVLLWPLARDRVERDAGLRGRTLWWRAAVLGLLATATSMVIYRLVALPSHHPTPELREQIFALRSSLRQFWLLATSDPGWVSLSAVLLAPLGAAFMAVRRPVLLVRVAGTLVLAFAILGRTLLHDQLVGARYFLFTIPIFLIASGYGFAAMSALVPRQQRRVAGAVGILLLALWTGLAARRAYAARYAFQDEYSFARRVLGQLPPGCTVYQVPIRPAALPRDVDCCLDLPRSPLVLDFPRLHFRDLPDAPAAAVDDARCVAYYESIACAIPARPQDAAVRDLAGQAALYFHNRCAAVHGSGRLALIAETTTSPRATENFFGATRPHAGLYRWTR